METMENQEKELHLHIIGNGFDLSHQLPTSVSDYELYLKAQDPLLYQKLRAVFAAHPTTWSSFEANLVWVDNSIRYLLAESLGKWAKNVDRSVKDFYNNNFTSADLFLSFNLTNSLKNLYLLNEQSALHIHGEGKDVVLSLNAEERLKATAPALDLVLAHRHEITSLDVYGFSYDEADYSFFESLFKLFQEGTSIIFYCHNEDDVKAATIYADKLEKANACSIAVKLEEPEEYQNAKLTIAKRQSFWDRFLASFNAGNGINLNLH